MFGSDSDETRFTFFGGKGGVGKTSLSAATALLLSEDKRVLIISTDPAHSLSDAFGEDIRGETEIQDGLHALEIDPDEAAERYREEMAVEEMPEAMQGMDMLKKTPGVDEMAAFNQFMKYMRSGEYDHIVFDTAPTGHTLNLLQLPEVMDSMVGKFLRLRMRMSDAIDMVKGFFGSDDEEDEQDPGLERLKEMKSRIEEARELLASDRTSFNFVLIPEKMSILETERAIDAVRDYSIPVGALYMNKVLPRNDECEFCSARFSIQQENIADANDRFDAATIREIPMMKREVQGLESLQELSQYIS